MCWAAGASGLTTQQIRGHNQASLLFPQIRLALFTAVYVDADAEVVQPVASVQDWCLCLKRRVASQHVYHARGFVGVALQVFSAFIKGHRWAGAHEKLRVGVAGFGFFAADATVLPVDE